MNKNDALLITFASGLQLSVCITRCLNIQWKFIEDGISYTCMINTTDATALTRLAKLAKRAVEEGLEPTGNHFSHMEVVYVVEGHTDTRVISAIGMKKYHELQIIKLIKLYGMKTQRIPSLH